MYHTKIRILFIATMLCMGYYSGMAQINKKAILNAKVYGKIIDASTNEPVEFVTVVLKTNKDSLITGSLSKSNGDFLIDDINYLGSCKLYFSFLGYQPLVKTITISPQTTEQDIGNLKLNPNFELLKETEVIAEKSTVQMNIDKRVFNVGKDLSIKGGNGMDVVKNIPGLAIDADNNVTLRNSNVQVFIDGRPTTLQLNQLSADQIDQIEVISNPSVKFDASSSGGIVNIVMKKNTASGYNGTILLGIGTNKRYNGNVLFNYKVNKLNLSTSYNFTSGENPTKGYIDRTYYKNNTLSSRYRQDGNNWSANEHHSVRIAADYFISNRSTLTISNSYVYVKNKNNDSQIFNYFDSLDTKTEYGNRYYTMNGINKTYAGQAFFKHNFPKKGKELTTDFNINASRENQLSENTSYSYNGSGSILLPENPELNYLNGNNSNAFGVYSFDFVNPITDSIKIETGIRSSLKKNNSINIASVFSYNEGIYISDTFLTNIFNITENINAAYFNYIRKLKNGLGLQAGLRFEQTYFNGKIVNKNQSFSFAYPSNSSNWLNAFFPAIYFSKKTGSQEIQLNFSRKINRANFFQLNPTVFFMDKQNIRVGNPNLRPEFINMAELNYNKTMEKSNFLTSLYSKYVTNPFTFFFYQSPNDPNLFINTFVNAKNRFVYGIEQTVKWSPSKKLDFTFNVNAFNTYIETDLFKNSGFTFNSKAAISYKLPFNISSQINANYEHPRVLPQGLTRSNYFLDFSLAKSYKMWNFNFLVSDLFNTKRMGMNYNTESFKQLGLRRREARFVRLSVSYSFGRQDLNNKIKKKENSTNFNSEGGDF